MSNAFDENEEEFGAPASTVGVKWEDHKGTLFALKGIEQRFGVQTDYGTSDPVLARVVIVDGPEAGTLFEETLVFPKVLGSALRPFGKVVVGRLNQGEAKRGQSAPWILDDPTDRDIAQAKAAWSASRSGSAPAPAASGASPY